MQKATLFAFLSVLCASTLLLGPYAAAHTLWNLVEAIGHHGQSKRANTMAAFRQKVAQCTEDEKFYRPDGANAQGGVAGESKSGTGEIDVRIGQEEILFGLKFTLVGGIMAALFSLLRNDERDFFEKLVHKRRAAAFFAGALLIAAIVDSRLRFNAKVMESLGSWGWCVAHTLDDMKQARQSIPWELYFYLQLDRGVNPLMRNSSHLLTSVLYGVAVYLFIVIPRTVNRATRAMLTHSGAVFFAILVCIALSYDSPYGGGWALWGAAVTVLIGAAGLVLLCEAYRERFTTSNACQLTAGIVRDEERSATIDRALAERAHKWRRAYDTASILLEPARFTVDVLERLEENPGGTWVSELNIPWRTWCAVSRLAPQWRMADRCRKALNLRIGGKLSRRRQLRLRIVALRFALRARCYEWRIARHLRSVNAQAAHAAEESLWNIYFHFEHIQQTQILQVSSGEEETRSGLRMA